MDGFNRYLWVQERQRAINSSTEDFQKEISQPPQYSSVLTLSYQKFPLQPNPNPSCCNFMSRILLWATWQWWGGGGWWTTTHPQLGVHLKDCWDTSTFERQYLRVLELLETGQRILRRASSPWKARGLGGAQRKVESGGGCSELVADQ